MRYIGKCVTWRFIQQFDLNHFDNFVFVLRMKVGYEKPQLLKSKSARQR